MKTGRQLQNGFLQEELFAVLVQRFRLALSVKRNSVCVSPYLYLKAGKDSKYRNSVLLLEYEKKYIFFSMSLAAQSRAVASSFLRFFEITYDTPQSVGLLWTSDQLVAETST